MKGKKVAFRRVCSAALACCLAALFAATAFAADEKVEKAIQIAVDIANDNRHGYGDYNRAGNPDYDCASFVCSSFAKAGFDVNPLNNVGSMIRDFTEDGFVYISDIDFHSDKSVHTKDLQRGDILLKDGHTEIYLGWDDDWGTWTMVGAHLDYDGRPGDSKDNEVNVRSYYVRAYDGSYWEGVLRYPAKVAAPVATPVAETTLGDIDDDGEVSVTDARSALRAAVGLEHFAPETAAFAAADADGNGEIDVNDARLILRAAVGLAQLLR